MQLSADIRVAVRPAAEYASIVARGGQASWPRVFARPVFIAVLIGACTEVAATERVNASLMISGAVCWSFVPALQVLTGFFLVHGARHRVSRARALELLFLAHAPWSLWLLTSAALVLTSNAGARFELLLATALIPAIWTGWLIGHFCCVVLGDDSRAARRRTLAHQAATWAIVLAYVTFAIALWPRIVSASS